MASGQTHPILRFIRQLVHRPSAGDGTDAELVRRFAVDHDEEAFAWLVQRHGAMVLGVCQRILRSAEDVEDAFQATFLVLVRKAGSLSKREAVGNWLYGVACRVAAHARVEIAKRTKHESQIVDKPATEPADGLLWRDLQPVLDEEIERLPVRYRASFVLCYLEGRTNEEAAQILGCPKGTILSRLSWARERLRSRLTRRGLTLSAALLVTGLSAQAAVSSALADSTIRAGMQFVNSGVLSSPAVALSEKVLQAMRITRMKRLGVGAVVVCFVGIAAVMLLREALGTAPQQPPTKDLVREAEQRLTVFTDVQAAMKAPPSVTFRQIVREKGEPETSTRGMFLATGLMRFDHEDGSYSILDSINHKSLAVDPKKRTATLMLGARTPELNIYDLIMNLAADKSARALPGKKIDGKDVIGFTVEIMKNEVTVWADPKTRLPLRIEGGGVIVMDEFVYDKELDPKLFSFDIPEGYKLSTEGIPELQPLPKDAKLVDLVVTPLVGIGDVKFGMSREQVEKILGKPDDAKEFGEGKVVVLQYLSRGFIVQVSKNLGVSTISCVDQKLMAMRVRNFSGKTDKGIALGASEADIVKAYGPPNGKETNNQMTYLRYYKLNLHFTLGEDRLMDMMIAIERKPGK